MNLTKRKRILLVEDDAFDLELTVRVLQANGVAADVDVATDGEDALNYLYRRGSHASRTEPLPSLIVLDLKMPRLSGTEVLADLRGNERFKHVPVVMLTSSGEAQDLKTCYQLGANGYVIKPVGAKEFSRAIRDLAAFWVDTNQTPPY